jgi:hypothetical protein
MKKILFFALLICTIFNFQKLDAQILNIESLRQVNKDKVWSGSAKLSVQYTENNNTFFLINNIMRVQRKKEKHLWLIISDYNLKTSNGDKIVSRGIQHLRYNYKFKERLTIEGFVQNQFDEIRKIGYRRLFGAGLRYKISTKEKYKFYSGISAMKEWEKERKPEVYHDDWRMSMYFSFSLFPTEKFSVSNTTYFQPKIGEFDDYRLSTDLSLKLNIFKNLNFTSRILYTYDINPAIDIPKYSFQFTNGLLYTF